jgi:HAD superfamily phosphatase (TIGR01681 family)
MLDWLPNISDFRRDLRAALDEQLVAERLERLARLAQHRLNFLETLQLDRALSQLTTEPTPGFSSIRLAILASSTVDHLLPAIRVAGLRRRILIEVYAGAYGQYRQELLDRSSPLHVFAPNVILFSVAARDGIAGLSLAATMAVAEKAVTKSIDDLRRLWRSARDTLEASVIQETCLNIADPVFGSYDRLIPGAPSRLIAHYNDGLAEAAAEDAVVLLDIARVSERDGIDAWFDPTRWLQAKMEIAPQAAPIYGDLVARVLAAQRGLSKKCLVLDLDDTLWGGVIGDDGIEGIILGEGSAAGEAHLALQRYAKQLSERGVILAICSKNDPAIAETTFRDHPEMFLKRSDIAAFVANWDDKAANLKAIATRLNIGVDSLVFVDDNPVERARIRQSLPLVSVPEMPADIAHYVRRLADAGYFEAVGFTAEDRERAGQYAANLERG